MAEIFQDIYTFLSRPYSLLILAFILDLCMGDPEWLPHPVKAMGWVIRKIEDFLRYNLRITGQKSHIAEKLAGVLLVLIMVCSTFSLFYVISIIFFTLHSSLFTSFVLLLVMGYFIGTTLAVKGLIDSAKGVITALTDKNIADARIKVGRIVGRDTHNLDEKGVLRATIESLAENASDGIVAPIFYFAIGGLPLAMTYKAINTMDSMIGYKNERHMNFGWAAARLDDIANYIPARITGLLIAVSSGIVFRSLSALHYSLKTMFRDGRKHSSPNSGVPEAAMAGALGIRIGGPSTYDGVPVIKPYIGDASDGDYLSVSENAINIVRTASILGTGIAVVILSMKDLI